jgi:Polyketide cyclase / dehydrase and lipid transport
VSVRLEASAEIDAPVAAVWAMLIDWTGQSRWIPLTTVQITNDRNVGLGVRAEALSGLRIGRFRFGLLDRFIVTGWSPPATEVAELEILHLGPYFTGEGVFRLTGHDGKTTVCCIEVFSLPGGQATEWLARLALPLLRAGFASSLRALGAIVEAR